MTSSCCRLCGGTLFPEPVLALNGIPKAAQYYPEEKEFSEDRGIVLSLCQCSACGLVQHNRAPVDYFREVITAASFSPKTRATRLTQMRAWVGRNGLEGKKVLQIGSGKGDMLDILEEAGCQAFGLEASADSVVHARSAGRKMMQGYIEDMQALDNEPFDGFIALNYLEHLPSPGAVIRKLYQHTGPDAAGYVTVPSLDFLLRTRTFYEFVADHLSYFTTETLTFAFESNGFDVLECALINEDNDIAAAVKKRRPLDIAADYREVEALIRDMRRIIDDARAKGRKVAVWGAGHRTLALLALAGPKDIQYVVDSAPFKQGRFTPVTHLRIVAPEHLKQEKVDVVLVMVPGLYPDEVVRQLKGMDVGVDIAVLRDNKIQFEST